MTPPWHLSYMDNCSRTMEALPQFGDFKRHIGSEAGCRSSTTTRSARSSCCPVWRLRADARTACDLEGRCHDAATIRFYYPEIKNFSGSSSSSSKVSSEPGLTVRTFPRSRRHSARRWTSFCSSSFHSKRRRHDPNGTPRPTPRRNRADQRTCSCASSCASSTSISAPCSLACLPVPAVSLQELLPPVRLRFAKLVYNPLKGIPALMSRETQLKNPASASS